MAPALPRNPIAYAGPTATIAELATLVSRQQATVTVVKETRDSDDNYLSGGAIAGIVLGSILGTLLLLWIIRSCCNMGAPPGNARETWYRDVESKPHRHHHHSSSRHRRSRRLSSVSVPPPVIIRDSTVTRHSRSRGRRHSRVVY
jgi:hypothetical protein